MRHNDVIAEFEMWRSRHNDVIPCESLWRFVNHSDVTQPPDDSAVVAWRGNFSRPNSINRAGQWAADAVSNTGRPTL